MVERIRKPSARSIICFFVFIFLFTEQAEAGVCDLYRDKAPTLYKLYCQDGSGGTKPAGANSTFTDSFNINTASLPTEPSSYGLEVLGSYLRSDIGTRSPTFSLIKGYHRFGTGISTGSNNTFYGDDVIQRATGGSDVTSFQPAEPAKGHFINLNVGTSVLIFKSQDFGQVHLGLSLRYNNISDTWGWGPGVMYSLGILTLGTGFTRETISNLIPTVTFSHFLASVRLSIFEFEYTVLADNSQYQLPPIQIETLSINLGHVLISAAVRQAYYQTLHATVSQPHFGIQWMVSKHFSVGALYNYIPGANTLGLQYFL
jgi:hypothetical protein